MKMSEAPPGKDFYVTTPNKFIKLLCPVTDEARAWVEEFIDLPRYADPAYIQVWPKFLGPILAGIEAAGLTVEEVS